MEIENSNGKHLREIRISLGYSQRAFAKFLGVGFRTLQQWEYGDRRLDSLKFEGIKQRIKGLG